MSCDRPKCLFPIANIPILLYSLEFLAINNVTQVILVSTKEHRVFKQVFDTFKLAHSHRDSRLTITPFKLDKADSVASALREINDAKVTLKDDFIIMQGDIVTNARLKDAMRFHNESKKKDKNGDAVSVIMTKIFAQIPFANPVRDPS